MSKVKTDVAKKKEKRVFRSAGTEKKFNSPAGANPTATKSAAVSKDNSDEGQAESENDDSPLIEIGLNDEPTFDPDISSKGGVPFSGAEADKTVEDEIIDVEPIRAGKAKAGAKSKVSKLPATLGAYSGLERKDPLVTYLEEIKKYGLMTPDEERNVAIKYKETGDPALAHKLVMSNLRFVVKIAAEYSKFGPRMIDVIQEGNLGLMHAVKEFNPYKGVRLITYAVWWIRGYIREYLMRQYSMVRLGTTHNQKKLFYQLQQEEKKLGALGFKVDTPLLSSRLGVSEEEVDSMRMRLKGRDLSLDQPLDDDSRSILLDMQTSPDSEAADEKLGHDELLGKLRKDIEIVRPRLNPKEIFILENRLLADEPMTLQEVGDKMGITRERARQLEARVILRIKEELENDLGEEIAPNED